MRYPLLAAALAAFFMPNLAQAQVSPAAVCGERGKFLAHLGRSHGEAPSAMGVTATGRVLEVLTSAKGTWTIIVTHPNGISCMVTAGQAWEYLERITEGPTT